MIFSAYRACCCLGEICGENVCCFRCEVEGCEFQIPVCGCYEVPCDQVPPEDRNCPCQNFSPEAGGAAPIDCSEDCVLAAFGFGGVCEYPCNERPGSSVVYAPIKCVECSYFDSNDPALQPWSSNDPFEITAGTSLLEETICRRAVPGVTSGTDFGSPNFGDDGGDWWLGGTGGIFENNPCEVYIDRGGTFYYLASIEYCGCTGCTTPELFLGATTSYWEGNGTLVPVNVCGLSGW